MPRSGLGLKKMVWTFWIEQKTTKNMKKNIIIWMAIIKVKNFTTYCRKKMFLFNLNLKCMLLLLLLLLLLFLLLWCNKRPFECQEPFCYRLSFPNKLIFFSYSKKNLKIEINFFQAYVKTNLFFNPSLCLWSSLLKPSCCMPFMHAFAIFHCVFEIFTLVSTVDKK